MRSRSKVERPSTTEVYSLEVGAIERNASRRSESRRSHERGALLGANRSWRLRRQEAEDFALVKDLKDFSRRLQNSKAHREFNQEPEMLETKTSVGW